MELAIAVAIGAFGLILVIRVHRRSRTPDVASPSGIGPRPDIEPHRRRAEAEAEMEEHDLDDMLNAIAQRRRRRGGRDIGEELADELLRGTWDRP